MSDTSFKEIINEAHKLIEDFEKKEGRPWGIEGTMIELSKQVGELAQNVMMVEKYYVPKREQEAKYSSASKEQIADELVDILHMTIRAARHYNIDLEDAHHKEIDKANKWLEEK